MLRNLRKICDICHWWKITFTNKNLLWTLHALNFWYLSLILKYIHKVKFTLKSAINMYLSLMQTYIHKLIHFEFYVSCEICHWCKNTFTKTFSYWCKFKIHSHIQINFEIFVKFVIFVTGAIIHSQIKIYVEICVKYWIFVTGAKIHSHRLVPK